MAERRKRRKWSVEEKRRIVAQTKVPGVSVPQVARRYNVSNNMIFKWVRDSRFNFETIDQYLRQTPACRGGSLCPDTHEEVVTLARSWVFGTQQQRDGTVYAPNSAWLQKLLVHGL